MGLEILLVEEHRLLYTYLADGTGNILVEEHRLLYTYLADGAGNATGRGA